MIVSPTRRLTASSRTASPPQRAIVDYFVAYADEIAAPIRCGVEVKSLRENSDGPGFLAETPTGAIEAANVVVATGPFQRPIVPDPGAPGLRASCRSTRPPIAIPHNCRRAPCW